MENKPATFVSTIRLELAEKMTADLIKQGFELTIPPYTIFSAKKKGISCTLYKSGKLTVQGKEMAAFIEFYLEPEILGAFDYTYQDLHLDKTGRIGIDESGKGDFFGPLCIAGVYAEGDGIAKLKEIGVRDSKKITDPVIRKIGDKIRNSFMHHIVKINPLKYNELITQFDNLNSLLAWGHATTIENLVAKSGCQKVIIDQFANERVVLTALKRKKLSLDLTQRHRGEEDVVVAAASILARQAFIEGLDQLSKQFSIELNKGASAQTIQIGRQFIKRHGRENLGHVAKLHFKTLDSILGEIEK